MKSAEVYPAWVQRTDRILDISAWLVPSVGMVIALFASPASKYTLLFNHVDRQSNSIIQIIVPVFFIVIISKLILKIVFDSTRVRLIPYAAALVMWGVGSITINNNDLSNRSFPTESDLFFASAYVGFLAFLLLDRKMRKRTSVAVWLDAVVAFGGVASLIVLVVNFATTQLGESQIPLLFVALFIPLLDILLISTTVYQILFGVRERKTSTVKLLLALSILTVADISLAFYVARGQITPSGLVLYLWPLAFTLLTSYACSPRPVREKSIQDQPSNGLITMVSAAMSVAVLVSGNTIINSQIPTIFAVATLAAAGIRMLYALKQSKVALAAYQSSLIDDLTGLMNRRALTNEISSMKYRSQPIGILLADLPSLRDVIDSAGHGAAESVLRVLSSRLQEQIEQWGKLACLGGEEFAILVETNDGRQLESYARRVLDIIKLPLVIADTRILMRANIGIAASDKSTNSADDLLRQAGVALYRAKESQTQIMSYEPTKDGIRRDWLRAGEELQQAIEQNQIVMWYQPQIDSSTSNVVSVEALIRWIHPFRGVIPPGEFLDVARHIGMMDILTEIVIKDVITQAISWKEKGINLRISFNMAPNELLNPLLIELLIGLIGENGLDGSSILVEITEDSFLSDPEKTIDTIEKLRSNGIEVAIDDYGTGYSSLSYLLNLNIQELKIDKFFISKMLTDDRTQAVVENTIQLAHSLGMRVVAEGVETQSEFNHLAYLGTDVLQGYLMSKPLPSDKLVQWLLDRERVYV